ncbi:MAG: DUF2064 domain-containing protein [Maribacter sp.]
MKLHQKKTALLVFSLSAEKEIERKHIFDKNFKKESKAFFNLLISHTKSVAQQSGADVFWVDEHHQTGADFSTRLTNAFQELFDAGYKNVVSIGNDCPDLTEELLKEAVQKLHTKKLIVGPSSDGGVYLLGINRDIFDKNAFSQLPWQTAALQQSLKNHFHSQKIEVAVLNELTDLDTARDVRYYAKNNKGTVLGRYLRVITSLICNIFSIFNDFIPSLNRYAYIGLRAPPIV